MTLYKVLNTDGTPYHGGRGGSWPLPRGAKPGKWLKVAGPIVPCRNGLHVCSVEHLLNWIGPAIWTVETRGDIIDHGDKLVVAEARLLVRTPWDDRMARLFACDCAERALRRERRAGRAPDARSWGAVKVARRFADGLASSEDLAAASSAAWATVGDAARDARDAARDTAGAAWAAARDAAWAAARAAASAAARDAAWDAAWDAARAVGAAARTAEQRWQTQRLIEYLDGTRGNPKATRP